MGGRRRTVAVSIDGASTSAVREQVGARRVVTAEGGSLERRLTGEAASGRKAELQSAAAALAVTAKIVVGHPPARNARERRKLGKFRYGGAAATGTKLGIDVKTGHTRLTVGHSDAQIKPAPAADAPEKHCGDERQRERANAVIPRGGNIRLGHVGHGDAAAAQTRDVGDYLRRAAEKRRVGGPQRHIRRTAKKLIHSGKRRRESGNVFSRRPVGLRLTPFAAA